MYKSKLKCEVQNSKCCKTFEHMIVKLNLDTPVLLCIIYKLHSKQQYRFTPTNFMKRSRIAWSH